MNAPEIQSKNMKIKTLAAAKSYVLRIKNYRGINGKCFSNTPSNGTFPHRPCSCYMECKETSEQPLLYRQRPRCKEAEFNITETATACFLLYPAEFISIYLCSTPQTSPCTLLISIRAMRCKENKLPSTMTARETEVTCNSSAWFQGKTAVLTLSIITSPLLVPEL